MAKKSLPGNYPLHKVIATGGTVKSKKTMTGTVQKPASKKK